MGVKEVTEAFNRLGAGRSFYGVAFIDGYGIYNNYNKMIHDLHTANIKQYEYKEYTRPNRAEDFAIIEFNKMQYQYKSMYYIDRIGEVNKLFFKRKTNLFTKEEKRD